LYRYIQSATPSQVRQLPQPLSDLLLVLLIHRTSQLLSFSCFSSVLQIKGKLVKLSLLPGHFFLSGKGMVRGEGIQKIRKEINKTTLNTAYTINKIITSMEKINSFGLLSAVFYASVAVLLSLGLLIFLSCSLVMSFTFCPASLSLDRDLFLAMKVAFLPSAGSSSFSSLLALSF